MEIQFFDGDRFLFRVKRSEPLWGVVAPAADDPERLRARLEEALRRLRPGAIAGHGFSARDLDVLGERVSVDVRNPANYELVRASDLETRIRDATDTLRAFDVPDLPPHTRRLAMLIKESGDGVPAAQLQELHRRRLDEIVRGLSGDDEVYAGLRREADEAGDPRVVWRSVTELQEAGLVDDGNVVRPTEKLRLILL